MAIVESWENCKRRESTITKISTDKLSSWVHLFDRNGRGFLHYHQQMPIGIKRNPFYPIAFCQFWANIKKGFCEG